LASHGECPSDTRIYLSRRIFRAAEDMVFLQGARVTCRAGTAYGFTSRNSPANHRAESNPRHSHWFINSCRVVGIRLGCQANMNHTSSSPARCSLRSNHAERSSGKSARPKHRPWPFPAWPRRKQSGMPSQPVNCRKVRETTIRGCRNAVRETDSYAVSESREWLDTLVNHTSLGRVSVRGNPQYLRGSDDVAPVGLLGSQRKRATCDRRAARNAIRWKGLL